jgi:hypothetical protein
MRSIFNLRNAGIAALVLGMTVATVGTASAQSRAYCDRHATDYANDVADPGAEALRGGVGGALFGAGIGAIVGGGVGTFAGAANASAAWRRAYDRAYADCMRSNVRYDGGRSERPSRAAAPEPGSREWYDYCSAKYRSFNPDTGYYRGYDDQYHLCR